MEVPLYHSHTVIITVNLDFFSNFSNARISFQFTQHFPVQSPIQLTIIFHQDLVLKIYAGRVMLLRIAWNGFFIPIIFIFWSGQFTPSSVLTRGLCKYIPLSSQILALRAFLETFYSYHSPVL